MTLNPHFVLNIVEFREVYSTHVMSSTNVNYNKAVNPHILELISLQQVGAGTRDQNPL